MVKDQQWEWPESQERVVRQGSQTQIQWDEGLVVDAPVLEAWLTMAGVDSILPL